MSNPSGLAALGRFAFARLLVFRTELATLWYAFRHPETPWHLKAAMVAVVVYVLSPIDLIPDFIPVLGWMDDLILVPLAVGLIVRLLPLEVRAKPVRAGVRRHWRDRR